ncbi:MAG: Rieske 2Fe-2S domain-containing protein [Candidatus Binataceae bacterium]|nr:Rieske 2Fe-2S domain-containing protein [Candidatus Binataceae bacterium]
MDVRRYRKLLETTPQSAESTRRHSLDDRLQLRSVEVIAELRAKFQNAWVFVCEGSTLERPGRYLTDTIADRLVFVCRDTRGGLRGFFNACPHLGLPVLTNRTGLEKAFVCSYHGWRFSPEGRLTAMPLPEGYEAVGLRREDFPLQPIQTAQLGGLVFGCVNPGMDLRQSLGIAASYLDQMFPAERNWETIFNYTLTVDCSFEQWMRESADCWAGETGASGIVDRSGPRWKASSVQRGQRGEQVALYNDPPVFASAVIGTFIEDARTLRCILHAPPNLIVAALGPAVITIRCDPVDRTCTLLRINGYGLTGENEQMRRARKLALADWWGPLSPFFALSHTRFASGGKL